MGLLGDGARECDANQERTNRRRNLEPLCYASHQQNRSEDRQQDNFVGFMSYVLTEPTAVTQCDEEHK